MPWLGYACGTCDYCVSGWETLRLEQKNTGYSIDGGFAEYVKAYGGYVVRVPDGVDPVDAAPLTCAGVTTYKAIKVAGTRPSDLVAIFGVGGLGHLALQYARIAGGRVVAVDPHDEKLELAKELGAEFTVNAAREDPVVAIQKLGGADQAIALAVSPKAFEQAYSSLRRGGTLVFVALPAGNKVELPIFETVLNGITVVGSIVGTRVDLREVFELHVAGKTKGDHRGVTTRYRQRVHRRHRSRPRPGTNVFTRDRLGRVPIAGLVSFLLIRRCRVSTTRSASKPRLRVQTDRSFGARPHDKLRRVLADMVVDEGERQFVDALIAEAVGSQ
jgi:D-arabinose 1-dehydrogenase-like Zn-dependent alcohol dehydrogenase